MNFKIEKYKGFDVKITERILGGKKLVTGEVPSNITNKMLEVNGTSKQSVLDKVKKLIDKESNVKGI